MGKKKRSKQETATPVMVDDDEIGDTQQEENETYTDLSNKLAEIRKENGVIGYILRSTTQATIDLKEPEKIVEYAIFSSQVLDSSQEISELFEIGDIESVLIAGKESNALCMDIEGNKISIFMEKNTDHAKILKKVSP
jgi:predicted regulator of Ras-like GTPase activity (Roadblock/LC7/MglB family)